MFQALMAIYGVPSTQTLLVSTVWADLNKDSGGTDKGYIDIDIK